MSASREVGGLGANGDEPVVSCDVHSTSGDGTVEACGVVAPSSAQTSVSGGAGGGGGAFDAMSSAGGSGSCFSGVLGAAREVDGLGVNGDGPVVSCDLQSASGDGAVEACGVVASCSVQASVSGGSRGGGGAFDALSSAGGSGSCFGGVLGAAREVDGLGASGDGPVVSCDVHSASGDGAVEAGGVVASCSMQASVSGGAGGGGGACDALSSVGGSGSCFGDALGASSREADGLGANGDEPVVSCDVH